MYNVRFIEYQNGFQFKMYGTEVLSKVDVECENVADGLVKVNDDVVDMSTGCVVPGFLLHKVDFKELEDEDDAWLILDSSIDFEDIPDILEKQEEEKRNQYIRHSLARTRNNLYYLSRSNKWDWFVTLTLNPAKIDRYNYLECSKRVRKWFDNLRQRKYPDMYYLIVPELHKDGAWHFHGLVGGCKDLKVSYWKTDKKGVDLYDIDDFKYGWSTASVVKDSGKCSSYITKYITKEVCEVTKGRHRYWVSNNVQRGRVFEMYLNPLQFQEFRKRLLDKMTWTKLQQTEFVDVEYFELAELPEGVVIDAIE